MWIEPNLENAWKAASEPVVITGLGVLSSVGIGKTTFWEALESGRSGIGPITRFDASPFPCQIAGELRDFNPSDFMPNSVIKHWHRHVHQSIAASKLAVEDAELSKAGYASDRIAVGIGTSVGSPNEAYRSLMDAYNSGGYKKVSKFASSAFSSHAATVHVSVDFGLKGPSITIASGCSTGLDILIWGMNQLKLNLADAVVVGATESPVFMESIATASSLGILSKRNDEPEKAMRPFDRYSDGIVLSEGACVFILERPGAAKARGAPILGELLGYGSASEGNNPLILEKQGIALSRAMHSALTSAGLQPHEVDAIQTHGVSLRMYDQCEAEAIQRVFGSNPQAIPISAVKSMTGQTYSAGGALGVAAGLMTLAKGLIPPIINLEVPIRDDMDFVSREARFNDVNTMVVNAMSFGGTHCAIVLGRANS